MKSIQRHLTFTLLATVLTLSAAAGAFLYVFARSRLLAEFDRGLATEAQAVAARVSRDSNGALELNFADAQSPEFHGRHPAYFEIWDAGGRLIFRSPTLGSSNLPRPGNSERLLKRVALPDGEHGRGTVFQFVPRADEEDEAAIRAKPPGQVPPAPLLRLVLARQPHALNETLWVLGSSLCIAGLALAAGTVLAVTLAVRRGLIPLRRLAGEMDAIDAASLHHRFSKESLPAELQPICGRLNSLLDRLAEAFARERRFTSDAAHELRTPIAELRAMAEVALRWPQDARPEQNCRETLAIANQMEAMVTTLLSIARCEAGLVRARMGCVDLAELVRQSWELHRPGNIGRNLIARCELPSHVMVHSDRSLLLPLVGNLISNAFAHTPHGGQIDCRIAASDTHAQLAVSNTCHSLTQDDLRHIFEPFWRKDASRTGGTHCGLGLSLVEAYARSLGTVPKVELTADRRFQIAIEFNCKPPQSVAASKTPDITRPTLLEHVLSERKSAETQGASADK